MYRVGTVWEPLVEVKNGKTAELGKPGTITFIVTKPNGKTETIKPSAVSTGVYEPQVKLTEPGEWWLTVETTGNLEGLESVSISVKPKIG